MKDLVIKKSLKYKIKILSTLIGALILFGYVLKSELSEIKDPNSTRSLRDQRRGRTLVMISIIIIPILGLSLIILVIDFSKGQPLATITDKGILLKQGILFKQGLISWGEVDYFKIYKMEMSKMAKMVFIMIEVKDEKKLVEELLINRSKFIEKISRFFAKKTSRRRTGLSTFGIPVSISTMSTEFVLAEMQKRLDTYRENVKEPNKLM